MSGVTKIALYVKELQAVASVQHKASEVAQVLRTSVTTKMNKHAMSVASDGSIIKHGVEPPKALGSAAPGIVGDTKSMLFALQEQLMTEVKAAVSILRQKYDCVIKGFAEFSNKYIKVNYEHIFGMELTFNRKGVLHIGGFHLDFMNIIEKSGIIEFAEKVMCKDGFYKAQLRFKAHPAKYEATFFPAHWSREQVVEAIIEAYNDFVSKGLNNVVFERGKYIVEGQLSTGRTITIVINKVGKIITAYPKV
jgi:hypothetical protein